MYPVSYTHLILRAQQINVPQEVELLLDLPATDTIITTDPLRLKQVINNLINNAIKFTSKGACLLYTSKKSFTFLKVICVAILLSLMGISEGLAQGIRTSYFMDNVPARLKMNPALQPARGYFNIPAIGAIGLSAYSNKLSIDDFIDIIENENDFLNSDKFISRLDNKNTMNIDLTVDIISFGFYSGKGFWTVNLGARSIISACLLYTSSQP